ncbi:MAG: DUF1318 domain-containing protein [Myxococcota bacterium]
MRKSSSLHSLWLGLLLMGCVKAPNTVYMVDAQTALEVQASSPFMSLERTLDLQLTAPTFQAYAASEVEQGQQNTEEVARLSSIYSVQLEESSRVDLLLVRQCLGEGLDGLLQIRTETCQGNPDAQELVRVVQRINRNRRQLWTWLKRERPRASETEIIQTWRRIQLEEVVCGALIQQENGEWVARKC